jgi:hypothetical protein
MVENNTSSKNDLLRGISFGQRIAEQEVDSLANYFVETEQWRKLISGSIDIVYGPKGAGKSALYSLLTSRENELFDKGIIIVPAENPSGATAFADIKTEPPTSEYEFIGLWKLYFLCLIVRELKSYGVGGRDADELYDSLAREKLLPKQQSLRTLLLTARDYVKRVTNPKSLEGGVEVDPVTGIPVFAGKITLGEPSQTEREQGLVSIDSLLEKANLVLRESDLTAWMLLDRLDVEFEQSDRLEYNALRALFKAYLDMEPFKNISIKVFLRTDIWHRITDGGFREASHITRHLTITWQRPALLNLVVRRILANQTICDFYQLDTESILSSMAAQEELLKKLLPDQVDTGRNPSSFDWMLTRTQDGTKLTAPRELIHLLSSLKDTQIARLELGHEAPGGAMLFDRPTFKEALKAVSEERLTKTLYAENDDLKQYIEKLRGEKTQQNPDTLSRIWELSATKTREVADRLVSIGFFESRGTKHAPSYWVPFLYRDALDLVQGEAH